MAPTNQDIYDVVTKQATDTALHNQALETAQGDIKDLERKTDKQGREIVRVDGEQRATKERVDDLPIEEVIGGVVGRTDPIGCRSTKDSPGAKFSVLAWVRFTSITGTQPIATKADGIGDDEREFLLQGQGSLTDNLHR